MRLRWIATDALTPDGRPGGSTGCRPAPPQPARQTFRWAGAVEVVRDPAPAAASRQAPPTGKDAVEAGLCGSVEALPACAGVGAPEEETLGAPDYLLGVTPLQLTGTQCVPPEAAAAPLPADGTSAART